MSSDSPEERAHWRGVVKAFDGYMQYHLSANHSRRMGFLQLPRASRDVYEALGYRDKLDAVDEGIRRNAEFIDEVISDPVFAGMMEDEPVDTEAAHQNANSHGHSHDHSSGDAHSHTHDHSSREAHSHSHDHSSGTSTPGASASHGQSHDRAERHSAQDKVRSTIRSCVRDWSDAGEQERAACYGPCLDALERYFPVKATDDGAEDGAVENGARRKRKRGEVRVLVPGCGLGRLAMEVAARGFESQGNEFSAYMLLASNWVLNQTSSPHSHVIHPYLHSFSNHLSTDNLLRGVTIPDICPADVLAEGKGGAFSLVAGEFVEVYGAHLGRAGGANGNGNGNGDGDGDGDGDDRDGEDDEGHEGKWGAVVTCFFIDCARNVLTFLRLIHSLLETDGVWINIGPLLWHFENSPSDANGESSIELSLDEVKALARTVGFELHEEKMVRTTYTGMPDSMLRNEYNAAFWVATKVAKSPEMNGSAVGP